MGGQVLAANSAPTIFHLAKEVGAEVEEMDTHKLALVDSDWAYTDMRVAEDYISVIPITLKLQVICYLLLLYFETCIIPIILLDGLLCAG